EKNSFYAYGLVTLGLYVYLAQQCARYQEEVPTTGRRRYAGIPSQDADLRKAIVQLAARISAGEELLPMTKTVLPADDPLTRKIQKIFDVLLFGAGLCNRSLKVYIVDQPGLFNAFAAPTGHILVTTALLSETESHDEIAAILSHELAHLTAEHGRETWHRRRIEARLIIPPLLPYGLVALVLRRGRVLLACVAAQILVAAVPLTFLNLRASRQREREADYIGLLIMAQAGFDPAAAVICMEREHSRMNELVRQLQQQYGSDKIDVPKEWQTTHPLVAFGWASTHTYDFNILDPQFDTTQDEDDSQEALMRMIQQSMNGASASDPREYLLRVKDDTPDTGMVPRHIDKMHDSRRQHPRTKERSGPSTKLYQVLDAPEYRNERMVYTYDFGDRWEHLLTITNRAPASTKFHCIDGSGHGVAEDVVQDGWQVLIDAYRAPRPDEEQREKIHWYESSCSNRDPKGLGNRREYDWDKDAVNMRLSVMRT
ncbi:hypothetical protein LTR17_026385, partial [Elasticomyces elasticus]